MRRRRTARKRSLITRQTFKKLRLLRCLPDGRRRGDLSVDTSCNNPRTYWGHLDALAASASGAPRADRCLDAASATARYLMKVSTVCTSTIRTESAVGALVPSAAASCCETMTGQVSSRRDATADMAGTVRLAGGRAAGVMSMAARMHDPTRALRRLRGGRRVQMCEAKGCSSSTGNRRVAFPCAGECLVRLSSYLQQIYIFTTARRPAIVPPRNHLRSNPHETTSLRNYLPTKLPPTNLPPHETTQGMLYFCLRPQILRQDQALPHLNEVRSAAEQARYLQQVRLQFRRP